jgi:hypothetical protein
MLTLLIVFGEGLGELEDPLRRGGGPPLQEEQDGRNRQQAEHQTAAHARAPEPAAAAPLLLLDALRGGRRRSPLRLQAATAAKRLPLLVAGHAAAPVDVVWLNHDHEMATVCDSSTLSSVRAPWSALSGRERLDGQNRTAIHRVGKWPLQVGASPRD